MALAPDPDTDHYNYDVLGDCGCWLCSDQRRLEAEATATEGSSTRHRYRCQCHSCKVHARVSMKLLAASSRRDTYSELSFLVRDRAWAREFLAWTLGKLADPKTPDWWWAYHNERRVLGEWVREWATSAARIEV